MLEVCVGERVQVPETVRWVVTRIYSLLFWKNGGSVGEQVSVCNLSGLVGTRVVLSGVQS